MAREIGEDTTQGSTEAAEMDGITGADSNEAKGRVGEAGGRRSSEGRERSGEEERPGLHSEEIKKDDYELTVGLIFSK